MRTPRKVNVFLSFCLIFSVVIGSISLPVFAAEKTSANFEQSRAGVRSNSSGPSFGRQNAAPEAMEGKSGLAKSQRAETKRKDYVEGEILVKYKSDKINLDTFFGRASALNFTNSRSLERKEDLRKNNISVLRIKDAKTVEQKVAELKSDPNIEYVEPNYRRYPAVINTDDTYKDRLWGLDNTEQLVNGVSGTNDADIDAPEAWVISESTAFNPVIVAVIDSGVAYNHPDLITNMWDGSACVGEDSNGNPLSGACNHGYDFEDDDKTPLPTTSSHGTHIAGTIAATKNNSKGVIGVASNAKIMALKFGLDVTSEIKAIDFAIQNGAKIINASFGAPDLSQAEFDAISRFREAGGIFVAAAGNEGTDNDNGTHSYPSDYDLDNIVSVAATNQNDALADFSSYGSTSVDVGAPGVNIYSTGYTQELFTDAVLPNFTNTLFTKTSGNWKTGTWADVGGDESDKNTQANSSYINNDDGTLTLITPLDTTIHGGDVWLSFYLLADIEYEDLCLFDYISVEVDNNDNNWEEKAYGCGVINEQQNVNLGPGSSAMRVRFIWHTDEDVVGAQVPVIDNITISNTNSYEFMQGTSMAAPHVAGLAGLIWGYKPSLTSAEVKSTILETGDDVLSHATKTVTGKRINAFSALNSLMSETHAISGTIRYYDGVKTVPGAMVILEDGDGIEIATTTTDIGGSYQFADVASGGDYVVRASKSDNTSGLSGADQGKIGRHIVGLELFDSIYKTISGDVNNSGGLSGADQGKIGRFIVGLDSNLPSGAWKFYSSEATLNITNYLITGLTRIYTNLIADTLNQDFVGIKMGDVNNSWTSN
ncbi:hypothetical protein BK004_02265 [bacterium CG10_46_32]|nr:MAG: hypothetical protein BK004_02265 [bacterium CG10_46_32]